MMVRNAFVWVVVSVLTATAGAPRASAAQDPGERLGSGPVPPATISREPGGQVTVRAVRLADPLRVDGRLDEPIYETVPPLTGFLQEEPSEGAPATERTEAWLLFDRDNVYVAVRCWESEPERVIANEMRRDNFNVLQNDNIAFIFDTFDDRRNGVLFNVSPLGGRMDGQVTDERQYNGDWNPVWDLKTSRFSGGWQFEAEVPFKSLRYRPGTAQVWGFNIRRLDKAKNEISNLTLIPRAWGIASIQYLTAAATVVGLEAPANTRTLDIKPYATSDLTSNNLSRPRVANDVGANGGLDAKIGVTRGLTADLTYRTDFAQVEADEQQINLTRFSLFFPEKRDFFLENQGLFVFGGADATGGNDVPVLFYSRRIGLSGSQEIPIQGGGRLTGQVGRYSVGVIDIRSDSDTVAGAPATNFSVLRVKRNILRRSSVGAIFTGRSVSESTPESNSVVGGDASFGFFDNLKINAFVARSHTGQGGAGLSYRAQLDYAGDLYGAQLETLAVDSRFDPGVGFVRRSDMRKVDGLFRYSPRPAALPWARKLSWTVTGARIANGGGHLESTSIDGQFDLQLQNTDQFTAGFNHSYEFLPRDFTIAPGVVLPVAGYSFDRARIGYNFGRQRALSGNILYEDGAFYDGRRRAVSVSSGRVNVTAQLSLEPTYSFNRVRLTEGAFDASLAGSRVTYTMTPLMFASALVQFNSTTNSVSANVRLRWEYRPGSELFVVYNEDRNTLAPGFPGLNTRSVIVKVNRLLRF